MNGDVWVRREMFGEEASRKNNILKDLEIDGMKILKFILKE
jgi:hypothetical protein